MSLKVMVSYFLDMTIHILSFMTKQRNILTVMLKLLIAAVVVVALI